VIFFIDAHHGRVATSGVTFYVLRTTTATRIPPVNVEMTVCTTAICILYHLQCFWSTFTGVYAKFNQWSLSFRNFSYDAQKVN